ncbi:hypothetical protein CALCODRAFT_272466 [Calocera cornea HHB12733]|uniref:LysM domain-containing protein n=1 Tax=Calocera cornea HHB12733 TaxID=1353952 RepID=A0A165G6H5_9BASI|nr:hypothetical protein CALCODRAFT_272466 [Calocera cornea HHB12733]
MPAASSALCSTCASSLLPSSRRPSPHPQAYTTPCCARPICTTCLARNPRLRGYNPCLACLGGVGAVSGDTAAEEDVWVLGGEEDSEDDDDDEEEADGEEGAEDKAGTRCGEAQRGSVEQEGKGKGGEQGDAAAEPSPPPAPSPEPEPRMHVPYRHVLKPTDTLLGLSMKYKVDGHALCRLNNLPPSTLRTTPHLLHTRTHLLLPPTAAPQPFRAPSPDDSPERKRERAIKRFQLVTKEVDADVARAYVALEEDDVRSLASFGEREGGAKAKAPAVGLGERDGKEARAVERYLDDEEWVREAGAAGGGLRGAPWFEERRGESSASASASAGAGAGAGGGRSAVGGGLRDLDWT